MTNNIYDSDLEQRHAAGLARIGFVRCNDPFPIVFVDAKGKEFTAKPDFYNPMADLYIELKGHPLNHKKCKANADSAMARLNRNFVHNEVYHRLQHAWNHSAAKHAAIQGVLGPSNYAVVFDKAVQGEDLFYYLKKGLAVCTLKSLPTFVGYCLFRKLGLAVSFNFGEAYTLQ